MAEYRRHVRGGWPRLRELPVPRHLHGNVLPELGVLKCARIRVACLAHGRVLCSESLPEQWWLLRQWSLPVLHGATMLFASFVQCLRERLAVLDALDG